MQGILCDTQVSRELISRQEIRFVTQSAVARFHRRRSSTLVAGAATAIIVGRNMIHPDLLNRLCHARDLLRDWEEEPLSIRAVARASSLTRFHFIRLFKAVFGETPHQYRLRAQIEKAKHLLILTDSSITDICMAVGFSSHGSFSTRLSFAYGQNFGD